MKSFSNEDLNKKMEELKNERIKLNEEIDNKARKVAIISDEIYELRIELSKRKMLQNMEGK